MKTQQRQSVIEFFSQEYSWWADIYAGHHPKGFFSYEMICRKDAVLETVQRCLHGRKDLTILECGCGPGGILKDLPLLEHSVFGLDINISHLRELQGRVSQSQMICSDIESLPFARGSFDIVLCIGVLSYLSKDDQAIAEMSRLLKTNGYLVLANPNYFMIDKLLDPYYLLIWPFNRLWRLLRLNKRVKLQAFSTQNIRRYRYGQLDRLFGRSNLRKVGHDATSYGPLRFWHRDFLSLAKSILISDGLVAMSKKRFRSLVKIANHWVICLQKQECSVGGGR